MGWSLDTAAPVTVSGPGETAVIVSGKIEELPAQEEESRELEGHKQRTC